MAISEWLCWGTSFQSGILEWPFQGTSFQNFRIAILGDVISNCPSVNREGSPPGGAGVNPRGLRAAAGEPDDLQGRRLDRGVPREVGYPFRDDGARKV